MTGTRDAFEAEILKNKAAFQVCRVASGEYQSGTTQELWECWQSATALERERCAKVCEAMKTVSGTADVISRRYPTRG